METALNVLTTAILSILLLTCITIILKSGLVPDVNSKVRKEAKKIIAGLSVGSIESIETVLSEYGKLIFKSFNERPEEFDIDENYLYTPALFDLNGESCRIAVWINGKDFYRLRLFTNDITKNRLDHIVLNWYDRELIEKIVEVVRVRKGMFKIVLKPEKK